MSTSTDLRAAIEEIQDVLPGRDPSAAFDPANLGEDYQRQALERFAKRLGAVPWWMISAATHVVLFLLIGLLAVGNSGPREEEVVIFSPSPRARPLPEETIDSRKPVSLFPVFSPYVPGATEGIKAPIFAPEPTSPSEEMAPLPGKGGLIQEGKPDFIDELVMGTGYSSPSIGSGGDGPGGAIGFKTVALIRGKHLAGPDGSGTVGVADAALRWLATHQEADGSWDPVKHGAKHGDNVRYRVGCTGLALLAFLGHGETEKSGRYANVVRLAEEWLIKQQKPNGGIFEKESGGSSVSAGYNHAIAGLALAEAYGMAGNQAIGQAAQRAVDYSINVHQSSYSSGWRYDPKESSDLSVTGWFVMQLKSARMVGLKVDGKGLTGASAFIDKVFDKDGHGSYTPGNGASSSMTAVAMVCRQFTGLPNTDPVLLKASENLLKDLPDWKAAKANGGGGSGDKGMYYWYYGTLGMFQMGREHGWLKWNEVLKTVLIDNQRRDGDEAGSWDPQSWIDQYGGRVFTTAMGALTLEVYYRYPAMMEKQ